MKNEFDMYLTKEYKKVEAVVQLMVNGLITGYRLGEETGISKMSLTTLLRGTSKIKNLSFQTALALIDWYDVHHKEYKITINENEWEN